jgi:hypothetical protein
MEKEAIRQHVSPQLAELWECHPVFKGYGLVYTPPQSRSPSLPSSGPSFDPDFDFPLPAPVALPTDQQVHVAAGQRHIAYGLNEPVVVDGHAYIPLVRNNFALTCGLDILFLRKGREGALIAEGGDLDNRIKTLFDGLRVPNKGEVREPSLQEGAGAVTFCLLEDDALITDFSVRTDRLLTTPGAPDSQVLLVIDVVVRASHLTSNNLGFLSE